MSTLQERFEYFLNLRGVKRLPKPVTIPCILTRSSSGPQTSSTSSTIDSPTPSEWEYNYVTTNKHRSRRSSRHPQDRLDDEELKSNSISSPSISGDIPKTLPTSVQDAFHNWEVHDMTTKAEIEGNGGVYDPFRPELTIVDSSDPFSMSRLAPGAKFRDSLELRHLGLCKLRSLFNIRKYKNNLSVVLDQFLVTCSNSEVYLYPFDVNHLPNKRPILRFDLRPSFTTSQDRYGSTWPYFPHTINFVKVGHFNGDKVIGFCLDDGRVMVYKQQTILDGIEKFRNQSRDNPTQPRYRNAADAAAAAAALEATAYEASNSTDYLSMDHFDAEDDSDSSSDEENIINRNMGFKIKQDYMYQTTSSCWGLDFKGNYMAISDNSRRVSLLVYEDEKFYVVKSEELLHNIPEVSFISADKNRVSLVCATIPGELVEFEFNFEVFSGPVHEHEVPQQEPILVTEHGELGIVEDSDYESEVDIITGNNSVVDTRGESGALTNSNFVRYKFKTPVMTQRLVLPDDCWTVKPISGRHFKMVQSIRAMTGDPWVDEEFEIDNILEESKVLGQENDPLKSSHLGIASHFQFFETPVIQLSNHNVYFDDIHRSSPMTTIDDTFHSVHKILTSKQSSQQRSLDGKEYWDEAKEDPIFLAVSTAKRLGVIRADSMFCVAATQKVFDVAIPFNDETRDSNRISITLVIEDLQCLVALTQQGLITVMRFCQHRGLYGMRQEHLFPNAVSLALGHEGYRTITGLAARNMSSAIFLPRYIVYVTYSDGMVLTYELKMDKDGILDICI